MLFQHLDWESLMEEIAILYDSGASRSEIDAATRALIRQRAERYDEAVDFDAIFNDKFEALGDALEVLDGRLIHAGLTIIHQFMKSAPVRIQHQIRRAEKKLEDLDVSDSVAGRRLSARIERRLERLKERLAKIEAEKG